MLDLVLRKMADRLEGAVATEDEIRLLRLRLDSRLMPEWLLTLLRNNRVAGVDFSLDTIDDESGLGVELLWLTPKQIVSEAMECQPGISVTRLGYVPIGACAEGSGDPYFLNLREPTVDPPVVRVPHDLAGNEQYPFDRIELVSRSLSNFLSKATF
jgi:hypothetical protein